MNKINQIITDFKVEINDHRLFLNCTEVNTFVLVKLKVPDYTIVASRDLTIGGQCLPTVKQQRATS